MLAFAVIKFLVDCGIRVTQNILNWARIKARAFTFFVFFP